MDSPKDICTKYCKQRLQRLVDDKACPFHLVSVETEMEEGELKVHTVCEGTIEYPFKTIIDRISKVTKTGINILKEKIRHEKQNTYAGEDWEKIKINESPNLPYTQPTIPIYPNIIPNAPLSPGYPWTVTCSVDSTTFTGEVEEKK